MVTPQPDTTAPRMTPAHVKSIRDIAGEVDSLTEGYESDAERALQAAAFIEASLAQSASPEATYVNAVQTGVSRIANELQDAGYQWAATRLREVLRFGIDYSVKPTAPSSDPVPLSASSRDVPTLEEGRRLAREAFIQCTTLAGERAAFNALDAFLVQLCAAASRRPTP